MSQHNPQSDEEALPFPDFHEDLFVDDPPKPKSRQRLIAISSVLLVLLIVGVVLIVVVQRRPRIVYQTRHVIQGDLLLTVEADGQLRSPMYKVNFIGSGKLSEINVSIGQQVKKDQVLAKLDTTSLRNALDEAQANQDSAQTALNNARANYDAITTAMASNVTAARTALYSASSYLALLRAKPKPDALALSEAQNNVDISTQQLSRALGQQQTQTTAAQGAIDSAQAALNTAQAQLANARYNLSNAVLKAPHKGTIASIDGTVGSAPGATFIQITDLAQMQVQANVAAASIGSVVAGDPAKFSLDIYPQQFLDGTVAAVLPLNSAAANANTYSVLITINANSIPTNTQLFPGMTMHSSITVNDIPNSIIVPVGAVEFARAAVKPLPETDHRSLISQTQADDAQAKANAMLQNLQQEAPYDKPAYVLVLNRQGKIEVRPIVTGLTNGSDYEVLDGLSTNDVVLVGARLDGK